MKPKIKLPYVSRYFSGSEMKLAWLTAVTANDRTDARHLNWHAHDELEIIFPLRGHYRYEFKRKKTVSIDSESFIVIPSGTPHRLAEAIDPPGGRIHLYLKPPSLRRKAQFTLATAEYTQLYEMLLTRPLRRVPATTHLKTTVIPLGKIITQSPTPLTDSERLQARLLCCLALCYCATGEPSVQVRSPSRVFAEATRWLERNYPNEVHMDQLVDYIGFSRARFFALFRRQTGMTPAEYLRNHRLAKAKEMLLETDLPAGRIGKACGLGAPAHFSRLFTQMTGDTPLAYRQRYKTPERPKPSAASARS